MKVLAYGGRRSRDWNIVFIVLDSIHNSYPVPISEIIHGAAPGVDSFAGMWAKKNKIKETRFPAKWKAWRDLAGGLRNQQMLDEGKPDLCVEFPGESGTADMHERVIHMKLRLIKIEG